MNLTPELEYLLLGIKNTESEFKIIKKIYKFYISESSTVEEPVFRAYLRSLSPSPIVLTALEVTCQVNVEDARSIQEILEKAEELSGCLKYDKVDCSMIFLAMLHYKTAGGELLEDLGLTETKLMNILVYKFGTKLTQNNMEESNKQNAPETESPEEINGQYGFSEKPGNNIEIETPTEDRASDEDLTLYKYSICMNNEASNGAYDPVFGRDKEIDELQEILCCRRKNNAVLLGDPGVGKSTIVEALAQRIVEGKVSKYLLGKKIFNLDLNSLVSGTIYRGQFEERLEKIIKEVTTHPEFIIYIDEFHNLIGSGSSSGNGDAANILKPYLARGTFQCIGATTTDEYRKYIEKDKALKRRFQEVTVLEPSEAETIEILESIKEKYQEFHGVSYDRDAIERCVRLAGRYITDNHFPDKAIDVLNRAGSKLKLTNSTVSVDKINKLRAKLVKLAEKKANAVKNLRWEEGSKILDEELKVSQELDKELAVSGIPEANREVITSKVIEETVSAITKIPMERLGKSDLEKLRGMKTLLESKLIGQSEAINNVIQALQRNSLKLRDMKKPIASFLLVGPTGTGKTYLCKTLATEFFGSENSLIRIDCSTLTDKSGISSLTGTTAGYIGYDDTPVFDKVKRKPFSLVLFDEIEKSSPEIRQSLLSILDDGYITLGNGSKVDFRNTIIMFTSNAGTKALQLHGNGVGFSKDSDQKKVSEAIVKKEIDKIFSPEFINRLTGIINFNSFTTEDLFKILDLEISQLAGRLAESEYEFTGVNLSEELRKKIIEECDTKYGARDLKRLITKYIEDPIAEKIIDSKKRPDKKGIKAALAGEDSKITFTA